MTQAFLYMLRLLNSVTNDIQPPLPPLQTDWDEVYEEANAHRLLPLIYRKTMELSDVNRPENATVLQWKRNVVEDGLKQMYQNSYLQQVLERMESEGIRVLLLKGLTLACLYPQVADRETVDADFLVPEESRERAADVFRSLGYEFMAEGSNDNEDTYTNGVLKMEMHTRLWEESAGERFEKLNALGIGHISDAVGISVDGKIIWTMPPQETIFYLMYHMIKHFFVCGIGVRYLSDVTLYVKHYSKDIDWGKFWRDIELMGYTSFTRCMLYLCAEHLGMDLESVAMLAISEEEISTAEKLLEDMAEGGHNGRRTLVRYKAGRVLRIYYENEDSKLPRSKLEILKRLFFPNREELANRKTMQAEYSKVIVVAWFQNLAFLYRRWRELRKERCSISSRVNCAQERLGLMHGLGLIG